ncbi:MAG: DNA internalization-related competence protein ComEC/Rec2, partial [Candidatus Tectimicrobiota bacterium]
AYLAGYGLGFLAPSWPQGTLLMLLIGGGLAAGWWAGLPRTAVAVVAALSVTGLSGAWLRPRPLPPSHLVHHLPQGPTTLDGWVAEDPVSTATRVRVRLRAEGVGPESAHQPVSGDCLVEMPARHGVAYGDHLRLTGVLLSRPDGYANPGGFDYRAFLARRGILVVGRLGPRGQVERLPGPHSQASRIRLFISRLRAHMLEAMDRALPPEAGAVLQAVVLGARERLSPEVRNQFRTTGTAHLLAISGLHVGFITVAAFWALRRLLSSVLRLTPETVGLRLAPSRWAALGTAPAVLFYALLVGGRVSTIRATIMILVLLAARMVRRPRNPFHAIALAALLILIGDPEAMFDVSFQLSFAAVAAILLAFRAVERPEESPIPARERTLVGRLARGVGTVLLISVVASLATWPLIARTFHRVAVVGPMANALAVPLASLTIPLGLVAALCSLFVPETVQGLVFAPAGWGASMLIMILNTIARIPHASVTVAAPSGPALLAYYTMVTCALTWPRSQRRGVLALAAGLMLGGATTAAALQSHHGSSLLTITALDAGRSQAVLLRLPDRRTLLWFGAPPGRSRSVARRVVVPALLDQRVGTIHALIAASATDATAKGLASVARAVTVHELWVAPQADGRWPAQLQKTIKELSLPVQALRAGWSQNCGPKCLIRALWPHQGSAPPPTRLADGPVLHVRFHRISALLTGDSSFRVERALLQGPDAPHATMVQVPKAGSRFASTEPFLRAVAPRVAVLAARSPASWAEDVEATLDRYERLGIAVWRVDRDGAVTWWTDGRTTGLSTVRLRGETSRRPNPGPSRAEGRAP